MDKLPVPAAPDYGRPFAASAPTPNSKTLLPGVMLLLIIACFVPRAIMAWRLDTVCIDGLLYFRLADSIEQGKTLHGLDDGLQFGTFPLALSTLHRLGFEWETAAKYYGVLISTLTILPLFGWVRRQFDDRVAFVAALCYAAHPKLIEWSPEAVRDPLYWFAFVLGLYCLWRGTTEVDWRFMLGGGMAIALASLTRFEGWFCCAAGGLDRFAPGLAADGPLAACGGLSSGHRRGAGRVSGV